CTSSRSPSGTSRAVRSRVASPTLSRSPSSWSTVSGTQVRCPIGPRSGRSSTVVVTSAPVRTMAGTISALLPPTKAPTTNPRPTMHRAMASPVCTETPVRNDTPVHTSRAPRTLGRTILRPGLARASVPSGGWGPGPSGRPLPSHGGTGGLGGPSGGAGSDAVGSAPAAASAAADGADPSAAGPVGAAGPVAAVEGAVHAAVVALESVGPGTAPVPAAGAADRPDPVRRNTSHRPSAIRPRG